MPNRPGLIVAIDIGTKYSGYAFAFSKDLEKENVSVYVNQNWGAGNGSLLSQKTPTCLLLSPKKEFRSFGYKAENDYSELVMKNKHREWYYFHEFKMKLYCQSKTDKLEIEDENGKPLSALFIFSQCIQYLKNHVINYLESMGAVMKRKCISWVLTVPAIWDEPAKQLMRKAAVKAGIPNSCLHLALEPEAASLSCRTPFLHVDQPGTVYMVADLGGGTVDITVHKTEANGQVSEVYKASGGAWGGTRVDSEFRRLIQIIIGKNALDIFSAKYTNEFTEFLREFELAKRKMKSQNKVNMKTPTCLDSICEECFGDTFQTILSLSPFKDNISLVGDKIRFDIKIIEGLFSETIQSITDHIDRILLQPGVCSVSLMMLVGGQAESSLIQNAFSDKYEKVGIHVVIPPEASLSVLKGAVRFGRSSDIIASRVVRYTYGVHTTPKFIPGTHNPKCKVTRKNISWCDKVFGKLVQAGTKLAPEQTIEACTWTVQPLQKVIPFFLYASPETNPQYVTEPKCFCVGKKRLMITKPTKERQSFHNAYIFGGTEIRLIVTSELTREQWCFQYDLPE